MPRFNGTGNSDLQDVRPISLTTQELSKAAVKARQRDKHPKYTHAVIAGQVSETGSMVFNIVHHTLHVCIYICICICIYVYVGVYIRIYIYILYIYSYINIYH
jgi:hypothetical protein